MNEFYAYFFANLTTDYDRVIQQTIIESDFRFIYAIDRWVKKQTEISPNSTFYHQ